MTLTDFVNSHMHDLFKTYLPWFILRAIPFLGNVSIKKLIQSFQTPQAIFLAEEDQLGAVLGSRTRALQNIRQYKNYEGAAKNELQQVLNNGFKITVLTEDQYPALLKKIPDPPPILTYMGCLENASPCIAVVGSRNATSYGLSTARHMASALAQKGFQIVSGMARGIDTMAHQGALDMKQKTIAVLGCGLLHIYPKENFDLFNTIAQNGVVVSEFKVNEPPIAPNFPIRNRIIAGMSCGTLVVEAAKRSGSLITARLAGEYNREVFAIPGSIKSKKSEGTHALLKNGACLVESEMDIIDELYQFIHKQDHDDPNPIEKSCNNHRKLETDKSDAYPLLTFMDPYPIHIDVLVQKSRMNCADVTSQLTGLELQGIIKRHPGNYYSISEENN